ncbi:hypothetical protein [Psychrobacillus psychrotolerans]|uniref:hypothetical protein n=1 Tax=Psychrobacillus psychrotolerans TaxID=126156 RepID=UPI0033150753
MKSKLWKEIIIAVLLISTILSFSPIAYGETTSVQQSIDVVKMEMKKAALAYVEPALEGKLVSSSSLDPILNNVKKNYEATKKVILASNLSEKEKQAKLKEIEALYEEKIIKGLIPYIDAYNYASKYLEPLLKEVKEAEVKNDFLAVEKAYHKLSVQLKSRTSILYRFTGKAPRDLLLERYKKPADATRDEMMVPVTIIMKATTVQQLYQAGKIEEVKKAIEDIPVLVAKLSSTKPFHQALLKELERLQAIVFPAPPVTPPSTGGSGNSGGSSETSAQRALRIAKADAIKVLMDYKVNVKADYSTTNWAEIEKRKATGISTINSAITPAEVTQALVNAKAEVDKVLTTAQETTLALDKAKANANAELTSYKTETDYSPANWITIKGLKDDGTKVIKSATTTKEVTDALNAAKIEIDKVLMKSNISTIIGITVKGEAAVADTTNPIRYNVELQAGTNLANLTATDIIVTPTDIKALVEPATTTDGGATWEVKVIAENGTSTTTYTINVTVTPIVILTPDSLGTAGNRKITDLTATSKYVITEGTNFYGVLANGTLSVVQPTFEQARKLAQALIGTEITSLTNGTSYKVEIAPKAIAEQFADPNLATAIAQWMGKTIDEGITKVEINDNLSKNNGSLHIYQKSISSMDGFEIFNGTQLINLYLALNNLQSLDVSGLSSLEILTLGANPLQSLNVSGLTRLKMLTLENNHLSSLDLSGLDNLEQLIARPLTGDKIKSTDALRLSYYHLQETLVAVGSTSGAIAGNGEITGLVAGTKYVVKQGADYYGVLANGTLSASQTTSTNAAALAEPLTDTKITGLKNGWSYKVEVTP